jgi:hypothetical protein
MYVYEGKESRLSFPFCLNGITMYVKDDAYTRGILEQADR